MKTGSAAPSPLLSLLTGSSISFTTTLVHIKQTSLQSCAPLLSELVHGAFDRMDRVIFLTAGQRPAPSYLWSTASHGVSVVTLESSDDVQDHESGNRRHWTQLRRLLSEARQDRPITLIIESLDSLLDITCDESDPAQDVYRELQQAASMLPSHSRLAFVTSSAGSSLQPALQSRLLSLLSSPHFLKTSQISSALQASAGPSSARDTPSAAGQSAPLLTVQLHPPALWRRLLNDYGTGLRPASTSSQVAQQLRSSYRQHSPHQVVSPQRPLQRRDVSAVRGRSVGAPASDLVDIFDCDARRTDPRLWPILARLESTSDVTREDTWFLNHDHALAGEEVEAIRPIKDREADEAATLPEPCFDPVAARITLNDLLGPPTSGSLVKKSSQQQQHSMSIGSSAGAAHRSRVGWGVITAQYRLSGGKFGEDIFGCVPRMERHISSGQTGIGLSTSQGETIGESSRLRLVPLEMYDRRAANESTRKAAAVTSTTAVAPPKPRDHSSFVDSLPFKLSLTEEQRLRRDNVELPFAASDRIYEGISKEDAGSLRMGGGGSYEFEEEGMGLRRGTTGQSTIYFEPDSADEEDEEDPDEDLDF